MSCIFCDIVSGNAQAKIVYSDEKVVAFKDLNPQAPTHILIVPRKHIASLSASEKKDIELLGHIQYVAALIAKELKIEDGFRVVVNNGRKAGQSVDHLHYHLLAGRRFNWPPG